MSSSEMNLLLHNLGTIAAVEAAKAYKSPGTVAGTVLKPYATTTLRMESSGSYIISRPDGEFRAANGQGAIPILVEGWINELKALGDGPRFYQAVSFINGPAVKAAEAYAASHR